jgi:RNA polymerase sigma-70 factor (ECF subfamily)
MTNVSAPKFTGGGFAPNFAGPGQKINQRIERPELSDRLKASRMADADSDLVLRSQGGDPAAFEELVRQYQHMVHALTYRMAGSLADAEDLAQETFLRAYEQIGSFRGASKFSTWLYRIAMNTCLNWRQSELRRCHLYAQAAEEFSTQHADAGNFRGDQSAQVRAALLKLPAKQRAAVVLTLYQGLNHAEAAQILNCSETTVSWRMFAAKRKLKRLLSAGRGTLRTPPASPEPGAEDCAPDRP